MATRDEKFGELRSLLQQTPSEEAWARLCALLEAWKLDEHFHEVVLPYAATGLERWPEDLKIGPASWVKPLLRKTKKPAPLVALATGLNLRASRIGAKTVEYLAAAPEVEHITYLDLSRNGLKNAGAITLANSPYLKNLKVLLLAGTNLKDEGAREIAHSANLANLDELDLSDSQLLGEGCRMIENSPHLCQTIRERAFDWYDERHPYDPFWE